MFQTPRSLQGSSEKQWYTPFTKRMPAMEGTFMHGGIHGTAQYVRRRERGSGLSKYLLILHAAYMACHDPI
jgi:hypothetical protein